MGDFLVNVGTLEEPPVEFVDANNSLASGDGRSASAVDPVDRPPADNEEAHVATAPAPMPASARSAASCDGRGGAQSQAESTLHLGAGAPNRGDESGESADAECSERGLCGEQSSESRDEGTCRVASIASSADECSG